MSHPDETKPDPLPIETEADVRAAMEILRLVHGLEQAGPDRPRRIEPHLAWLIARNAGFHGLGPAFLRFVRGAVAVGRRAARAAERGRPATGDVSLTEDSDVKGHA